LRADRIVVVKGRVCRKWLEDGEGFVELELRSENAKGVSVGPGTMTVTLPRPIALREIIRVCTMRRRRVDFAAMDRLK